MKIIIDTNFLLAPVEHKVDVFSKLKEFGNDFIILSSSIRELKNLAKNRGKKGIAARIALEIINKRKIRIVGISTRMHADAAIINYCKSWKTRDPDAEIVVATNDLRLMKALKKHGVKIVRLRQRKYLLVV